MSLDDRLRQLTDSALARMLTTDRSDYTAEALDRAASEAHRRGLEVTRPVSEPELSMCSRCARKVVPVEQKVLLPANTSVGVAAFWARSCSVCGYTSFWLDGV